MTKIKITHKNLLEKVLALEAKMDAIEAVNNLTRIKFVYFVYLIVFIEVINIGLNLLLLFTKLYE